MAMFTQEGNIAGATATVIDFTTVAGPGDNHKSASLKNDHATSVITGVLDSQTFTVLPGEERALTGIQVNSRLSLTAVVNPTAFRFAMSSAFEPPKIGNQAIPTIVTANIAAGAVATASIAVSAVTYARIQTKGPVVALADDATAITAAMLAAAYLTIAPTANRVKATDTAVALIAAMPGAVVGTWFDVSVANTNAGAFTLQITAGAGVTLVGAAALFTMAANTAKQFRVILTAAATVDLIALS